MPTLQEIETWKGRTAVDADGDKIGSIEEVYLDRRTGEPEWITVKTGLFGMRTSFVPIRDAQLAGDDVRVAHPKDRVKDAPNVDPDGELSRDEERTLYAHYGRTDYEEWTDESEDRTAGLFGGDGGEETRFDAPGTRGRTTAGTTATGGDTTAGPTTAGGEGTTAGTTTGGAGEREAAVGDDVSGGAGDDAMTRSEEELRVGRDARETGRARLRKYVTTEPESRTVPLHREEARVERQPITDDNIEAAMRGPEISEAEHEVTLHEEEPVVEKRVEPKERVRLEKDVHVDEHEVSDEVRKERIEPEGDLGDDR